MFLVFLMFPDINVFLRLFPRRMTYLHCVSCPWPLVDVLLKGAVRLRAVPVSFANVPMTAALR